MQVSDYLYFYQWTNQHENNCNSILIDGKTPCLIDPGHLHRVDGLLGRIERDGFDPDRIRVVICTHAHPDHFEGTAAFTGKRVKIGASRLEEKLITEMGLPKRDSFELQSPEFRVDFYLQEGSLILGKHELRVMLTPGHSPGSICIWWPRESALISGDVIFDHGVGRTDLPGGNPKELAKGIDRLSKLTFDLLLPGHGNPIQGDNKNESNFRFIRKMYFGGS